MDLRDFDRRALAQAGTFVTMVTPDLLERPTPCAGWTLADLLRHMVAQNNGWAEAADGQPARADVWEHADLGTDPAGAWQDSVDRVNAAFAAPDLLDRTLDVHGYGRFPAPFALGMHFVDYLVHAWDVARSVGADGRLDPELSDAALRIALRWPYRRPDSAFDVKVPVPADAAAHERLVGYLGRPPAWPA